MLVALSTNLHTCQAICLNLSHMKEHTCRPLLNEDFVNGKQEHKRYTNFSLYNPLCCGETAALPTANWGVRKRTRTHTHTPHTPHHTTPHHTTPHHTTPHPRIQSTKSKERRPHTTYSVSSCTLYTPHPHAATKKRAGEQEQNE